MSEEVKAPLPTVAQASGLASQAMAPARDPAIAVKEEFDLAGQRGTVEAFELFIARHPDSALADQARARIVQIREQGSR